MEVKLLDGIVGLDVDKAYYVYFDNHGSELCIDHLKSYHWVQPNDYRAMINGSSDCTPSFLHKSSLLFYLKENDLPYNEEDFIEVEPIDYTNFLVKEELKEISTELLKQELSHRGYAVDNLWSIHDVLGDMDDAEKLTKVNTVLNSDNVKSYINECLDD